MKLFTFAIYKNARTSPFQIKANNLLQAVREVEYKYSERPYDEVDVAQFEKLTEDASVDELIYTIESTSDLLIEFIMADTEVVWPKKVPQI